MTHRTARLFAGVLFAFLLASPFALTRTDALAGFRNPIVTSISPDQEDCSNPSSPGNTEDVQITGICFLGRITGAFLATNADGTGTRFDLSNVIQVSQNQISATVPIRQLAINVPYYVFVLRADGARSTSYPTVLGYNVTFKCTSSIAGVPPPSPTITSCRLVRISGGRFVLQVNGVGINSTGAILELNGTTCPVQKFPAKFIGADGLTTRVECSGGVKRLLPATLTITNPDGGVSAGFQCNQ